MEAKAETKEYEETIKRLLEILKRVIQERDEAREQLQLLLRNKSQPPMKNTQVSDHMMSSKALSNSCSYDLSLTMASLQSNEKQSMDFSHTCGLAFQKQTSHQNKHGAIINAVDDDSASLVINKMVWGKSLPPKGRLLQAVTEAGPLLQTLVVAPLPRWKNPPPLSSFASISIADGMGNVNPHVVIPTSLSLAFPDNSGGPSQVSSGSGLSSVKNEQMSHADMESNRIHNHHVSMEKKRKLF